MAYTQSHLDALQEALASGTLTVTFEGRSMTYRSVQELQARDFGRTKFAEPAVW